MTEKPYDLEIRTRSFASDVRKFLKEANRTIISLEDIKQLVRSSGSVGANYIEAREALSDKDYLMRIKICRKEVKESRYWLDLLATDLNNEQINVLKNEALEIE